MSPSSHKIFSVLVFSGLGVYSGVKFFEPLIIEQLKKDGNLRTDIEVPEFDKNGDKIINGIDKSESWDKLREKLETKPDDTDK